ncbi:MAG TPA: hypothetical protein VFH78_10090 [Candidatus Thermoplasmatota archaeon]|nr:hypothetical protein [Candidatus Thermoplasmatota archaeon]
MHRWLDRAIVALAFASVLLFALAMTGVLAGVALTAIDLAIVASYAIIFLAKGLLDERPARWFARHVWLAVALLPLTVPLLVAQPYFIVVQLVILLVRGAKALDRALHLHVVSGLAERYHARAMEEVTRPLLLSLANALEESLTRRDFAGALAQGLHERRELVEEAVRHGIESSPRLARVARFPPVQRWVDDTTRDVVDAAHAALASPQTNALLQEALRDAFRELREGIQEPKWPQKGIDVHEAAHRLMHPSATSEPTPAPARLPA